MRVFLYRFQDYEMNLGTCTPLLFFQSHVFTNLNAYFCTRMLIQRFKSKIHRVKVTQADLNYIGSITIDQDLIDASGLIEGEKVQIVNNNNGERFETYVIPGERGTGMICLNGAAARKVQVGDILIIIAYAWMDLEEAKTFKPKVVFPNEDNRLV